MKRNLRLHKFYLALHCNWTENVHYLFPSNWSGAPWKPIITWLVTFPVLWPVCLFFLYFESQGSYSDMALWLLSFCLKYSIKKSSTQWTWIEVYTSHPSDSPLPGFKNTFNVHYSYTLMTLSHCVIWCLLTKWSPHRFKTLGAGPTRKCFLVFQNIRPYQCSKKIFSADLLSPKHVCPSPM